jgi:hypothetical protein
MSKHPEVLWAQRSSDTSNEKVCIAASIHPGILLDAVLLCLSNSFRQNILYVTINLPDIVESTLKYDLEPTGLSFKAQAGYANVLSVQITRTRTHFFSSRSGLENLTLTSSESTSTRK